VRVLIGLIKPAGGLAQPAVWLVNDGAQALNFTFNGGKLGPGSTDSLGGAGGTAMLLPAVQDQQTGVGGQLDIQLFQSGGTGTVRTLTVSTSPGAGGGQTFVGQMLLGN